MDIEKRIVSYLEAYGNTKESDLINYGVQNLSQSSEKMKKILNRMAVKDKIHRVVHNKLKPPEVYITLEEPLPPETVSEGETDKIEVDRILRDAASIAEQIDRKMQP